MRSSTLMKPKSEKTELEEYSTICAVVTTLWDTSKGAEYANKYSLWFCLHGAASATFDDNPELAAELVFLRELWAGMNGFGESS